MHTQALVRQTCACLNLVLLLLFEFQYEEEEEGEEEEEELASADEGLSDLEAEAEEPPDTRQAKQLGARAEAYDEGTGSYEVGCKYPACQ